MRGSSSTGTAPSVPRRRVVARAARWVDDRVGFSRFTASALNHIFPRHWSFLLGEIALYSFVVLVVTGIFLAFFFEPSTAETVYNGSYGPLQGVEMSRAYESSVHLSWDVRAGLVMRQTHHWAALVFLAAIVAHLCRNFFTGAFRRPREINWVVGLTLLVLAMVNGFAGYSLLDDLLSGTGLRIGYSIMLAVPVIGTWLAFLAFGGEFPADDIISRLFVIHVLVVPVIIAGLLGIHLALIWRQRHTQFRRDVSEHNDDDSEVEVIGVRVWPTYAAKSIGLLAAVAAVLFGLGGLVQINPIWLWGPYDPAAVTTAAQPDWYMGWIEGAMRLAGPWRLELGPFTVSELFWPAVLLPTVTFALLYAWPFIDKRWTGDRASHHILERPRDRPGRTALGVACLTFYVVLFVAGSQDVIAQKTGASVYTVLNTLRVLVLVAPVVTGSFTYKLCRDLRAGVRPPYTAEPEPVRGSDRREHPSGTPALAGQKRSWTDRLTSAVAGALVAGGIARNLLGRSRPRR